MSIELLDLKQEQISEDFDQKFADAVELLDSGSEVLGTKELIDLEKSPVVKAAGVSDQGYRFN